MNVIHILVGIIVLISSCGLEQRTKVASSDNYLMTYLGQEKPSDQPEIFAPNIISKQDRYEFGCTFSKSGEEFFFGIEGEEKAEIYYTKLKDGIWTSPEPLYKNALYSSNDPMLSPNENRLYFISDTVSHKIEKNSDIDIWYSEREGDGWSDPINAGDQINSSRNEYFISFSNDETMYFSSNSNAEKGKEYNYDIYYSKYKNGKYLKPNVLPQEINTSRYEADAFIADDESYIIFCAKRRGGLGNGDLYISFKDKEGNWMPSVNMGPTINTHHHELCPFVTNDGKFLFFTSNKDIYWVSTEILDQYKR